MLPTDPATDPAGVVRAVAAGVSRLVAERLAPAERDQQLDDLAALYADETDVRHPLAPLGDDPLRTRAELREHFAGAAGETGGVERFDPANMVVHRTADPELVIVEFAYTGSVRGSQFELPCIFVVRVRDGRIVESRDYSDHLGLARTFGRLESLLDQLREQCQR
jgi:ketosteroid isomerase-like protein